MIVTHSLGTIVGYDLLADTSASTISERNVKLFVTLGSPLGLDLLRARVIGGEKPGKPVVPGAVPSEAGAWINGYDVMDIVALIHPLEPEYVQKTEGQILDERTFNPSGPHAIIDYLGDPDIAAPISPEFLGG